MRRIAMFLLAAVMAVNLCPIVEAAVNLAPIFPTQVRPGSSNYYRVLVSNAAGAPLAGRRVAYRFSTTNDTRTGWRIVTTDSSGWANFTAAPPAAWAGTRWINLDVQVDTGESAYWRVAR
jgi:hypothetical protein